MIVPLAPNEYLEASITVPVKDEENLLPAALSALANQRQGSGKAFDHSRYEVIVLVNNSSDNSFGVAREFKRKHPSFQLHLTECNFPEENSYVGYARRLLMDEACRRLEQSKSPSKVILTTDGDTQVSPNWLQQNLQEVEKGADAVGGRIVISRRELISLEPSALRLHKYDNLYNRLVCWLEHRYDPQTDDPWPRHHQHFGASLSVTVEAYKKVGGLPPAPVLEDVAFYQLLTANDMSFRHSMSVKVFTSARLSGKVKVGLSSQLREWSNDAKDEDSLLVESKQFFDFFFRTRNQLRRLWHGQEFSGAVDNDRLTLSGKALGLGRSELINFLEHASTFGSLLINLKFDEKCRHTWPDHKRLVSLKWFVDNLISEFRKDVKSIRCAPARRLCSDRFDGPKVGSSR